MRRRRTLLLLVALLALLAWLVWWLGQDTTIPEATDDGAPVAETVERDDSAAAATRPRTSRRRSRRADEPSDEPAPDEQSDSTETPAATATPSTPRKAVAWELTVLGPDDEPAIGVVVRATHAVSDEGEETRISSQRMITNAEGRVLVATGTFAGLKASIPVVPTGWIRLTEPSTLLRVPELLPLEVLVVDGETGDPVYGSQIWFAFPTGGRFAAPEHPTEAGARIPVSAARGGMRLSMQFEVVPPPGFALYRGKQVHITGMISRFSKSARAYVVLRPTTGVLVRVLEADGTPAPGARLSVVTCANRQVSLSGAEPADGRGEIEIGGLPYLRGEKVHISVSKDGRDATAPVVVLRDPRRIETVVVRLPATAATANSVIGIGGGAGGAFGGRGGRRTFTVGGGTIEVLVLRRNGEPAKNTFVQAEGHTSGRTDSEGRVVFRNFPTGEYRVVVREPGFVTTSQVVEIARGDTVKITLQESAGRYGSVCVVDAEGYPVPFATLTVAPTNGQPYIAMDDDVQLLDLHTNAYGWCELYELPTQDVTVTATFGSRTANGTLGPTGTLRLTLPEPPY